MKKSNPILTVFFAAAFGFFLGISFPVQIAPKVFPLSFGDVNSTFLGSNIVGRFSTPLENSISTCTEDRTPRLQPNVTSEKISAVPPPPPDKPRGAERLPPKVVARESDLHLRRLWGNPREDTPARKYLLVLTVGYSDKDNVNATVHKFSDNFDVMLFHYDGRTTEWDEFEWSKQAVHVSARGQAKWWYAKRFMHPSIVAPYEYIFLWDQDLGPETFDAEEYIKIVKKHGLEISQPGMDITRGVKTYELFVRRNDTEIHRSTSDGKCGTDDVRKHHPPCTAFVEVMAPVFTREAWSCAWHMIQSDLGHGWGLDFNFWRCVDDPERQMGVVDAQYLPHHYGFTLGNRGNDSADGSRRKVRIRAREEFKILSWRLTDAERAQAAALLAPPAAGSPS